MNTELAPRHLQLRDLLFRRWKRNGIKVGDKIESQNQIIKFCDFSLITVIKTLKDLEAEGVIRRQVGKGSYLVRAPWAEAYYRVGFFYNRDVVGGGIFNNSFYTKLVIAFEKRVVADGHSFIMGSFTHKKRPLEVWEALDIVVLTSITAETSTEFLEETTSQISVIDQTLPDGGVHSYRMDYHDAFADMFGHFADRPLKYLYLDSEIHSSEQESRRRSAQEAFEDSRSDNRFRVAKINQESESLEGFDKIETLAKSYAPDVVFGHISEAWRAPLQNLFSEAKLYSFTLVEDVPGFHVDPDGWMASVMPTVYANFENRGAEGARHDFPARFRP